MGFIKAGIGALSTELADSWKDFFYCDSMGQNILMKKGQVRVGKKSSNTKRDENIISDGSKVIINDGQCLIVSENGKIIDVVAEPGEYIYNTGTAPTVFEGGFKGLKESLKRVGQRFTYGGQAANDQRVYYINTKEILDNKIGFGDIPFRDSEFGFTIKIHGYGVYSYKITDPVLFYVNIAGNANKDITRADVDEQMRAEVQQQMQPALGKIAAKGIAYDQLTTYTLDIAKELNAALTDSWVALRGISVISVALASIAPDDDSAAKIAQFQESRVYTNPQMLGARLGTAQANAMEDAAKNTSGAVNAFMGMGMAQNMGGANAAQLMQMGMEGAQNQNAQQAPQNNAPAQNNASAQNSAPVQNNQSGAEWTCAKCGAKNTGKFCSECGAPKPQNMVCPNCGYKVPEGQNPPKFCPECGTPFNQ